MKTSNKLLITFALALILIPLMGMIYESQVNYETGERNGRNISIDESFSATSKNMKSIAMSAPFHSINIADGKGIYFHIRFIKDPKFGIKIPNRIKDLITASVDANGQLQILVSPKTGGETNYTNLIVVYAPNIDQINLTKSAGLNLEANADSLNLNVNDTESIGLYGDAKIGKLKITTNQVKELRVSESEIKSLSLNLIGTDFRSESCSYDYLSVMAAGTVEVEINGGYNETNNHVIKNLVLNTLDAANVKLENIKVDNCAGKFSDQTKVQMPAVNLNQMYRTLK